MLRLVADEPQSFTIDDKPPALSAWYLERYWRRRGAPPTIH